MHYPLHCKFYCLFIAYETEARQATLRGDNQRGATIISCYALLWSLI